MTELKHSAECSSNALQKVDVMNETGNLMVLEAAVSTFI